MKKKIFITGATGVMGFATLEELARRTDRFQLLLLVRDSTKNRKKLRHYLDHPDITVIWGDMMNYKDVEWGVMQADMVLHIGGMVSPMADHFPEKTMAVNVGSIENIVKAIKARSNPDEVKLVYIGSVAQMSNRSEPYHWGRSGDPVMASEFDFYGISKIKAERIVAESGLRYWVSLRQSGILHPGLFQRGSDPITFHVPLRGVLEWATVEDSGRLMANVCEDSVPEEFWRNFYNIGSGEAYRLTNYEFEKLILGAVGSPMPEKIFETDWFATRNFHGCWYIDSDRLEQLVPFRENIPVKEYFKRMVKRTPVWVRLAPLAPAFLVKGMMRRVAKTRHLGTLDWIKRNDCEDRIRAFFGSREERERIPGWDSFDLTPPSREPRLLDHGYDEDKPESELAIDDMCRAAEFRGGRCISESMEKGNLDMPLEWECGFGHSFKATPRIVLKGGHWCPECMPDPWRYEEEARHNKFIAQVMT